MYLLHVRFDSVWLFSALYTLANISKLWLILTLAVTGGIIKAQVKGIYKQSRNVFSFSRGNEMNVCAFWMVFVKLRSSFGHSFSQSLQRSKLTHGACGERRLVWEDDNERFKNIYIFKNKNKSCLINEWLTVFHWTFYESNQIASEHHLLWPRPYGDRPTVQNPWCHIPWRY